MQDKHLYEYAIIRVMPQVERAEFVNAGIILYCKSLSFLQARIQYADARITTLFPKANLAEIDLHLHAFEQICQGKASSPIALLDKPSRFRWLTAKRSTIIQASEVHPGFCTSAAETLQKLFDELVAV
jgi:hypothetical protein